mgnify:CR=1 FL=1
MKVKERENQEVQIQKSSGKRRFRCRQNERAEDPGCQGDTKNPEQTGNSRNEAALHPRTESEEGSKRYSKADRHPSETAGNHSDQGKTKETAGAENHTEAYHQDGSPVCEDQRPARAEAPCDQFQRPDGPDAEADGTKGSEAGGKESCHADFQQRPPDAENGKGRAEYLQAAKAAVEAAAKTVQS